AGIVLTAVLAAIMSTMSSQLLITSSALIEDIYRAVAKQRPSQTALLVLSRTMVVLVAAVAMVLAINPSDTILGLVAFAWAGFGASFGPVVIASLYWRRLTAPGAIAGMIVGAITVFVWGSSDTLSGIIYEIVPGIAFATIALVAVSLLTKPKQGVEDEFDHALAVTNFALTTPDATFADALKATAGTEGDSHASN
ncbi:sodium:proline symporter, partial [Corynebacterium sp. UMB10321]|nr:sodium:proline symporter [Corynebacterium sp. UMB10321]